MGYTIPRDNDDDDGNSDGGDVELMFIQNLLIRLWPCVASSQC